MSYQLGADAGIDDLHIYWVNGIQSDEDRFKCMCISERDFFASCALEGRKNLNFPRQSLIAKIACTFNQALQTSNGVCSLEGFAHEDQVTTKLVLRTLERKLINVRSVVDVWIRILIAIIFLMWTSQIIRFIACSLSVAVIVFLFCGSESFRTLRDNLLEYVVIFCDTSLIPVSHAGKLLLFPIVTSFFLRPHERTYYAILIVAPVLVAGIGSNLASTYSGTRNMLRIYYIFFFLLCLTAYIAVLLRSTLLTSLFFLMALEHSATIHLLNLSLMSSVVIFALVRDILKIIRTRFLMKFIVAGLLGGVSSACIRLMSDTGLNIVLSICGVTLTGILIPTPPEQLRSALIWFSIRILDIIEQIYLWCISAVTIFHVFQSSPSLALRWIWYCITFKGKNFTKLGMLT
jgi:hypothetical protein